MYVGRTKKKLFAKVKQRNGHSTHWRKAVYGIQNIKYKKKT